MRNNNFRRPGVPLFFKLWFAFCGLMALSIMFATVYTILHPEMIGEFFGHIVHGFNTAR